MHKPKNSKSKILQYIATIFLTFMTIGAFETSALSGFIMLLSTLIACPFTRNIGVKLVTKFSDGKIQTEQIKGWMFGVSAFVLMIIALIVSPSNEIDSDSQVAMVERGAKLETVDNREVDETEQVVEGQEENSFAENSETLVLDSEQEEKKTLSDESDMLEEDLNQEDAPTKDVKIGFLPEQEPGVESEYMLESEPSTEPISEPMPIVEHEIIPEPEMTPEHESIPEPAPESIAEPEEPIVKAPTELTGSYAVNGKNGKIHMVGACPATGTGDNAMTMPVYFNTYEEAEAYSISIKASLEKRKCGNCW